MDEKKEAKPMEPLKIWLEEGESVFDKYNSESAADLTSRLKPFCHDIFKGRRQRI